MSDFRIIVLASGAGTLFQELLDTRKVHQGKIVGLITDVDCPAQERAKAAAIPHYLIPIGNNRAAWDLNLTNLLKQLQPDLIVSAGFMKIIGPQVLEAFSGRIINTHPALLPKFPGAHAVADTLAAGEKVTGSTIHFVDEGVDTGEVIAQEKVEIEVFDNENTLHERIKVIERKLLVDVVAKFVSGELLAKAGN